MLGRECLYQYAGVMRIFFPKESLGLLGRAGRKSSCIYPRRKKPQTCFSRITLPVSTNQIPLCRIQNKRIADHPIYVYFPISQSRMAVWSLKKDASTASRIRKYLQFVYVYTGSAYTMTLMPAIWHCSIQIVGCFNRHAMSYKKFCRVWFHKLFYTILSLLASEAMQVRDFSLAGFALGYRSRSMES